MVSSVQTRQYYFKSYKSLDSAAGQQSLVGSSNISSFSTVAPLLVSQASTKSLCLSVQSFPPARNVFSQQGEPGTPGAVGIRGIVGIPVGVALFNSFVFFSLAAEIIPRL